MNILCSDLEGVYTPEIWINVAEKTGIPELRLTTRDEPDYDALMRRRLAILREHNLKLQDITAVIASMDLLDGAREFMDWIRERAQIIVVSDTFEQFAGPLMKKLGRPALLCHRLIIADDGAIADYALRQDNAKRRTVEALKSLEYRVIAFGDSYNDTAMLNAADTGILFRPPQNVIDDFPQFRVTTAYEQLKEIIATELAR